MHSASFLEHADVISDVLRAVRSSSCPVSVEFVAKRCELTWPSARAVLFQLALEGKITATKTAKSWIFEQTIKAKAETKNHLKNEVSDI